LEKRKSIGNLVTGTLIMVTLLVFFGLKTFRLINPVNWWAIFLLIPIYSSFGSLLEEFLQKKPVSFTTISSMSSILFIGLITGILLLNVDWVRNLPLFIIIAGVIVFQSGLVRSNDTFGNFAKIFRGWLFASGLAVIITGLLLFKFDFQVVPVAAQSTRWLGLPLLVLAGGGIFQIFKEKSAHLPSRLGFFANLIASFLFFFLALLALLNRQLTLIPAILMLAGGSLFILYFAQKRM